MIFTPPPTQVGPVTVMGVERRPIKGSLVVRMKRRGSDSRGFEIELPMEEAYHLARNLMAGCLSLEPPPRHLATVRSTERFLVSLLTEGSVIRPCRVAKGLPPGSRAIDIRLIPGLGVFEMDVEHPSFSIAGPAGPQDLPIHFEEVVPAAAPGTGGAGDV